MIEKVLVEKLSQIFKIKKVTLDTPSESAEQDTMFVQIETSRTSTRDGREVARVNGKLRIFSGNKKLPLGFFVKSIELANTADTVDFFFFDLEESSGRFADLVERSASFVFFYSGQYNPSSGIINEINFSEVSE
jgi:hypothetical protein